MPEYGYNNVSAERTSICLRRYSGASIRQRMPFGYTWQCAPVSENLCHASVELV